MSVMTLFSSFVIFILVFQEKDRWDLITEVENHRPWLFLAAHDVVIYLDDHTFHSTRPILFRMERTSVYYYSDLTNMIHTFIRVIYRKSYIYYNDL